MSVSLKIPGLTGVAMRHFGAAFIKLEKVYVAHREPNNTSDINAISIKDNNSVVAYICRREVDCRHGQWPNHQYGVCEEPEVKNRKVGPQKMVNIGLKCSQQKAHTEKLVEGSMSIFY